MFRTFRAFYRIHKRLRDLETEVRELRNRVPEMNPWNRTREKPKDWPEVAKQETPHQ